MKQCRENPPKDIAGSPVITVKDFASLEQKDLTTGTVTKLVMPTTSNVLQYYTADGTKISIRPSGTEPKIKFYMGVKGKDNEDAEQKLARLTEAMKKFVE